MAALAQADGGGQSEKKENILLKLTEYSIYSVKSDGIFLCHLSTCQARVAATWRHVRARLASGCHVLDVYRSVM
ncbi:hypothetical protein C1H46_012166 [Malus baccata]|uniref:Uncharacterized protein n=1 Tax=Malus baccata TaxID=106549 RepID=A0A540MTN4_MALBA|nr:hypothetical protein C1H46_012166 [Malus baccata]